MYTFSDIVNLWHDISITVTRNIRYNDFKNNIRSNYFNLMFNNVRTGQYQIFMQEYFEREV